MQYECRQGDVLDDICFKKYGTESMIPEVLRINHGLASKGAILPQGLVIELPEVQAEEETTVQQIKLYD